MTLAELRTKKIAVLGLGVEGIATAAYFLSHNISFTLVDEKSEGSLREIGQEWQQMLQKLHEANVPLMLGKALSEKLLGGFDVVIRSPGMRPTAPLFVSLKEKGVTVTSQTKLFFDNFPGKIIGVTGTKGKGTTSSLIYEMLKKAGKDAYLGGNIGKPPIVFLDSATKDSLAVLELSSYQLQDVEKSPQVSVMLMVTQEHLLPDREGSVQNYHPDVADYVAAKRNIVRFQTADDMAILNIDYPATAKSQESAKGKIAFASRYQPVENGCFVRDNDIILRTSPVAPYPAPTASVDDQPAGAQAGSPVAPPVTVELQVIDIRDILLPGGHNLENVCAAVMAVYSLGVSLDAIRFVLKTFKGLEHRLELVREVDGVRYYDDSFSTVPETAVAAIQAFTNPEILILGGSSKKSDFTHLGEVISSAGNIKAIIGIGLEWERIKEHINNEHIRVIEGLQSMKEIVQKTHELAESGDVVLLSPACASFGMFQNYKDRGNQFKEQVNLL